MIKVLHINMFSSKGGAAKLQQSIVQYSEKQIKHNLIVYENDLGDSDIKVLRGGLLSFFIRVIQSVLGRLGFRKNFKLYFGIGENFNSTYKKLSKYKEYQEADIIHLHNIHGGYFDLKSIEKISDEKKIIWTLHDMWPITGGEAYVFGDTSFRKLEKQSKHFAFYPLNNPFFDRRIYFLKLKKKLYEKLGSKLTFVPVSSWMEDQLRKSYVLSISNNIETIDNGIDTFVFLDLEQRNWEKKRVLVFNSQDPFKGSNFLLTNLETLKMNIFQVYTVGKALNIHNETHIGEYVNSKEELNLLFNQVDILIHPSRAESFGLLPCEAMASGVCVLGTDVDGLKEVLENCGGLHFPVNEIYRLFNKLQELQIEDVRALGKISSLKVREHYKIENMVLKYFSLYQKTMKIRF